MSYSQGIAVRYATALFELANEAHLIDSLAHDVSILKAALNESSDLRELLVNPVYSRDEKLASIEAIATKMGLSEIMTNTLKLMASKNRLFVVPHLLKQLEIMISDSKGEATAEVHSAHSLTQEQIDKLAKILQEKFGKTIKINSSVDKSLIGGLIVKVGSKMIDNSIRSKLVNLSNIMKEVG